METTNMSINKHKCRKIAVCVYAIIFTNEKEMLIQETTWMKLKIISQEAMKNLKYKFTNRNIGNIN